MKCPKCSYVSHDYLDACRKCSTDLVGFKQKFNLMVLQPGDLDLGVLLDVGIESLADRDKFRNEDAIYIPHGESHRTNSPARKVSMAKSQRVESGLDKMPADTEVDIQFDTENPTTSTEPGELTRTFYVPENLAKQPFNVNLHDRRAELNVVPTDLEVDTQLDIHNPTMSTESGGLTKMFYVGLDKIPTASEVDIQLDTDNPAPAAEKTTGRQVTPDGTRPLASPVPSDQYAQYSPGNTIDMSVGKLDDCFDEFEDIQLDTTEIDHDIDLALNLPSNAATLSAVDYGAPEKAREEIMPDIFNTVGVDKAPEASLLEAQEELFASKVVIDNLADDELGREIEVPHDVPSLSEERNAGTETGRASAPDAKGGEKI